MNDKTASIIVPLLPLIGGSYLITMFEPALDASYVIIGSVFIGGCIALVMNLGE